MVELWLALSQFRQGCTELSQTTAKPQPALPAALSR
jgi:hypothetical protein